MKHLNFILAGLFFLCGLCCRAQVLPLEENVVLNTKEGQIKGKLLLPGGVKTCPVVLIIAGSGPTDMDGNSAIGNLRNNSLKFLAEGFSFCRKEDHPVRLIVNGGNVADLRRAVCVHRGKSQYADIF